VAGTALDVAGEDGLRWADRFRYELLFHVIRQELRAGEMD
jgi:hypothetical protein